MSAPTPNSPGALNWALVLLLGLVWGTSFLSISISLETLPPLTVAATRTALAAIVLVAILPFFEGSLRDLSSGKIFVFTFLAGAIGYALPFVLLAWGQQFVPSAVAGIAMGTVPLLLVPLVFVFSPEEGIGPRRIAGLILGFVGLVLIVGPGATALDHPRAIYGALACVGAAMSYAVASILTRRAPKVHPIPFAAGSMITAAVILIPLALVVEGIPEDVSARSLTAVIYLAALPTALAGAIRVRIIRTAGSLFMSMVSYMVPVWSVVFGVVLLSERLPANVFVALALILSGILLSQWSALRKARQPSNNT